MAKRLQLRSTKLAHLAGHKGAVYDFALDKNTQKLYSAGADGYLVQWSPLKSTDGTLILQSEHVFYAVAVEGSRLFAGTSTGQLLTVELDSAQLLPISQRHQGAVYWMEYLEGKLLTGGADGCLIYGDQRIQVSETNLRSFGTSGQRWFVGDSLGIIHVLDSSDLRVIHRFQAHENAVFGMAFLSEDILVSTGRDARIRMWDARSYTELQEVPAHMYQAKSLSYNGNLLLSSSMDKTIKIWDDNLQLLKVLDKQRNDAHTNCINKVEWMNQEFFISSSDDRNLMVWQVELNP